MTNLHQRAFRLPCGIASCTGAGWRCVEGSPAVDIGDLDEGWWWRGVFVHVGATGRDRYVVTVR